MRELPLDGMVIYTGGFPARALQDLLSSLYRNIPASLGLFHWGDIDSGGMKILSCLQSIEGRVQEGRVITPWLMDQETSESYRSDDRQLDVDSLLSSIVPELQQYISGQLRFGRLYCIEQEVIPITTDCIPSV